MPKADFLGVFSTPDMRAESDSGAKGEQRKQYWFVWRDGLSKAYLAQRLDAARVPQGKPGLVPGGVFRQSFTHEPDVRAVPAEHPDAAEYSDKVLVRGSREGGQSTLVGGRPAKRGETAPSAAPDRRADAGGAFPSSAGPSASTAPEELDHLLRAEFAMNVMRLRRGDKNGAVREFRRMVDISDGIVPAHKHMFTDFGIDLRKSRLNDLALSSFRRALDLSPDDSHALFNVGRALYELGQYKEAGRYLDRALGLEPDLTCARRLKEKMRSGARAFIS